MVPVYRETPLLVESLDGLGVASGSAVMFGTALAAGALAGLASVPHCVVMCGPLAAYACGGELRPGKMAQYQLGRLLGYGAVGTAAGGLGRSIGLASNALAGALFSFALAAVLGLLALRLWRTNAPNQARLVALRAGRPKRFISSLVAKVPKHPLAFGGLTALLPCGALGAGVLLAGGTGEPLAGATTMVAFGVVTGPALLGFGALAKLARRHARPWVGRTLAIALALGAIVFVVRPIQSWTRPEEAPSASCPLHPS